MQTDHAFLRDLADRLFSGSGYDQGDTDRLNEIASRLATPSHAYVLMGNDYPDAVFFSYAEAEKALADRKKHESTMGNIPVYWKLHEFKVS